MFLSLRGPVGDKSTSLFADDLAGDEDFEQGRRVDLPWDCDRYRVNGIIQAVNEEIGEKPSRAFCMLFNQFTWKGTSGWEYWSEDYVLILLHALKTAAQLGVPLNVPSEIVGKVNRAAETLGIHFVFEKTQPVTEPNTQDFHHINEKIKKGEYYTLTNIVWPEATSAQ